MTKVNAKLNNHAFIAPLSSNFDFYCPPYVHRSATTAAVGKILFSKIGVNTIGVSNSSGAVVVSGVGKPAGPVRSAVGRPTGTVITAVPFGKLIVIVVRAFVGR